MTMEELNVNGDIANNNKQKETNGDMNYE